MKKMLLMFLFTILPICGEAAFVSLNCTGTSKNFNEIFVDTGIKSPCQEILNINSLFENIQDFSNTSTTITLFLDSPSYIAQTSISGMMLLAQRQKGWSEVRSLEKSKVIWAHEYGHIVFNEIMLTKFPAITSFYHYMFEHDQISIKKLLPMSDNYLQVQNLWSKDSELVRDIQKPYAELFADLVAVLYANNSSAMKNAMTVAGMTEGELLKTKLYDFNQDINFDDYTGSDPHLVLGPARSYIGKTILSFPMTKERKNKVLNIVGLAMISEMNGLWMKRFKPVDLLNINLSLINSINKELNIED